MDFPGMSLLNLLLIILVILTFVFGIRDGLSSLSKYASYSRLSLFFLETELLSGTKLFEIVGNIEGRSSTVKVVYFDWLI